MLFNPLEFEGIKSIIDSKQKFFCITENFINLRQAFSINNCMLKLLSVCVFEQR